jgi:hypothetical protein
VLSYHAGSVDFWLDARMIASPEGDIRWVWPLHAFGPAGARVPGRDY